MDHYRKERIEVIANNFVDQLQLIYAAGSNDEYAAARSHNDYCNDDHDHDDVNVDDVFLQDCIEKFVDGIILIPSSSSSSSLSPSSTDTDKDKKNKKQQNNNSVVTFMDDLEYEDLLKSFRLAGEKWKAISKKQQQPTGKEKAISNSNSNNPTSLSSSSFSLFDQLSQGGGGGWLGGGFEMPVTIDEIREVSTHDEEEKLRLLKKISYIDDLYNDWSEFQSVLKSSLLQAIECNNSNSNNKTDDNDNENEASTSTNIGMEYLLLHRKFYNLCRSSTNEYDYIAYGLCHNLLEVAITYMVKTNPSSSCDITTNSDKKTQTTRSQQQYFVGIIKNWRDMFMDLMIRNRYIEVESKEIQFLPFFIRNISSCCCHDDDDDDHPKTATTNKTNEDHSTNNTSILQQQIHNHPFRILSLIDPLATWFEAWVGHVTPKHLAYLLDKCNGVLPDLLERAAFRQQRQQRSQNIQAVAILSHILCKTRVSLFPWKQCCISKNDEKKEQGKVTSSSSSAANTLTIQGLQQLLASNDDDDYHNNNDDDEDDFKIGYNNTNFGGDDNEASVATAAAIKSLLNLFVDALSWDYFDCDNKNDNNKWKWKLICFNAIDTLLWGCCNNTAKMVAALVNEVLPNLNERILAAVGGGEENDDNDHLKVYFQIRLQEVTSVLEKRK